MDITKHIAQRVSSIPLGRQTSVAVPGLIGLSSGTPDFEPPEFIFEAMREAIDAKKASYTAWAGAPELRQAAAAKLERENRLTFNPDNEIMVKTKNRLYDMRGTLDHLEFNVIKFEAHASDNRESKVYLSKKLGLEVLDRHRSKRSVVHST